MKRMKGRLLTALLSIAMVFTMIPMMAQEAYAKGDSPSIVKSGDLYDFAKDAPITTVRIDKDKFIKANATLVSENDYYKWGTGEDPQKADSIWTSEVTVPKTKDEANIATAGNAFSLPSFSVTLKDAAIMRDNQKRDLEVTFDNIKVFTKSGMDEYIDSFRIVSLSNNDGTPGIDISPASLAQNHFGLQAKVTCQVVGAAADDTLLLVAAELNNLRSGPNTFERITGAEDNFNYSESMQFASGIDSESDIYLAESVNVTTVPADTTDENGYTVRFVGDGDSNTRLAAAVSASGASANVWSSGGSNPNAPIHMFCISPFYAPRQFTSSSGEDGRIELWTDGLTPDKDSEANSSRKLFGGTLGTPYTYAVPHGKEVTYRMTPDEGYVIDKLYVNGSETDPTVTMYKQDSTEIDYYEYRFDSDSVDNDQKISVTWKKYAAISDPIPVSKIITGSVPDKDQEFSFALERVPESDAPIDGAASNNADKIILKVLKGQSKTASEIPGLTFKRPGEYIYTVRELNEKVAGYTYDGKIYTVRYMIEPDSYDPDILICTNQTILDGENEVESCVFVNDYKSEQKPTPTPAPTPKPVAPKISGTPLAKVTAKGKTSLTISWNKIQGAAGYDIFFAQCNHSGKKIVCKNVKTIKGNKTFKWTKSGLKKGTAYKAYVRAYVYKNGKKTYVKNSPLMHAYTGNGTKNYTNAKSVTVKKAKVSLKKGKTFKIKAKVNKVKKNKKLMPKSHAPTLRYMTSNSKIASVNSGGKITAKGKGTCYIYVYAHNGVSKQVKVTVK